MPADETSSTIVSHPWNCLVNYERSESIFDILNKVALSFFRKDILRLVERDETEISSFQTESNMHSLLIFGHVSHVRQEAFLSFLRSLRLRSVRDVSSSVSIGMVLGDKVPECFLAPLVDCAHTKSLMRWYRVQHAARCGVLYKINERRRRMRDRLDDLLKESVKGTVEERQQGFSKAAKRFYGTNFYDLADSDNRDRRFAPLTQYDAATKETRLDMRLISANVPTIFIGWSYRDKRCIQRLKDMIFNNVFLTEFKRKTGGMPSRFATVIEGDPWIQLVNEYVHVRDRPQGATDENGELTLMPVMRKRAQIVLVNVDRDANIARKTYQELLLECEGWGSPEVSLISLWVGEEGLQSEFCTLFRTSDLPHIIATNPSARHTADGPLSSPEVVSAPTDVYDEGVAPLAKRVSVARGTKPVLTFVIEKETKSWHTLDDETRRGICDRLCAFISKSGAPLTFCARVDNVYEIENPYTTIASKALRSEQRSSIKLSGRLCETDIQFIMNDLRVLASLEGFQFSVEIFKASAPLEVRLDPMTPRRYVRGQTKTVTCGRCKTIISINLTQHYRCIHCLQDNGLLCEVCFNQVPATHPSHHIILRVPPLVAAGSDTVPLLWGPSNLIPLKRFCGVLITNNSDTHLGIYCNRCRRMITGKRWKCAVCYDYDVCNACQVHRCEGELEQISSAAQLEKTKGFSIWPDLTQHQRKHEAWHSMLCIQHGRDGDNNNFIRPPIVGNFMKDLKESVSE